MVLFSAKCATLISWSPICMSLILLSALMKLTSTLAEILHNSMESTHIRFKGLDSRPFILLLYLILAYANLIMWMNLAPYPNLSKAEKIKSTLKKDFYSVYLTHQLCHK